MQQPDLEAQISGVSLLAEPVRRALYDYVAAQAEPVGRVAVAEGTGVAEHTARFHLDRLVEEGLLTVEFRRLSGRSGPGAGRPSKLYRRSHRQLDLTLPRRQYELASRLLAAAVSTAADRGVPVLDAVRDVAHDAGRRLSTGEGGVVPVAVGLAEDLDELDLVSDLVRGQGYEPRRVGPAVQLANCPFDGLVAEHRDLVCGMNLALLDGVVEGLGCGRAAARLDPGPGRCCVVIRDEPRPG